MRAYNEMKTEYTMSNGATVIDCKPTDIAGRMVVLARVESGYHRFPFATWIGYTQDTNPQRLDCHLGHFFDDLSKAEAHFVERCNSQPRPAKGDL